MSNVITVWVLVISAYGGNSMPVISLPVADEASCRAMQQAMTNNRDMRCVPVKVVK